MEQEQKKTGYYEHFERLRGILLYYPTFIVFRFGFAFILGGRPDLGRLQCLAIHVPRFYYAYWV